MSSVEEWGEDSCISSITFLDVRREQGSVHDKMKRIESFNGYVKKQMTSISVFLFPLLILPVYFLCHSKDLVGDDFESCGGHASPFLRIPSAQ